MLYIYFNYNIKKLVYSYGSSEITNNNDLPRVPFQTVTELQFNILEENSTTGTFDGRDVSGIASWKLALDKDYLSTTGVMARTLNTDIDSTRANKGIIVVPVDSDSDTFLEAIDGQEERVVFCNLIGYNLAGKSVEHFKIKVVAEHIVDPNLPAGLVVSNHYDKTQTDLKIDEKINEHKAEYDHSKIAQNESGVATNAGNIATNTAEIAQLQMGNSGSRRAKVIAIADCTVAPPTETLYDRYILDNSGTVHADWDGCTALQIVEFNGTIWQGADPIEGWVTFVDDGNKKDAIYIDDGAPVWELRPRGIEDHEDLLNKGTKTHAQLEAELTDHAGRISTLEGASGGGSVDYEIVSSDTTLTAGKKYLDIGTSRTTYTLPETAGAGKPFEILSLNSAGFEVYSNPLASAQKLTHIDGESKTSSENQVLLFSCEERDMAVRFITKTANSDFWVNTLASYLIFGPISATGGTITEDSVYIYHTFTADGTFEVINNGSSPLIDVLIVAGGGGGGAGRSGYGTAGGGGGAGGLIYLNAYSSIETGGTYSVVIGAGGSGGSGGGNGGNGGDSSAFGTIAVGGGGGAGRDAKTGNSGGNGGGGTAQGAGGNGTSSQGYAGGNGNSSGSGGGGGGASEEGALGSGTREGGTGLNYFGTIYATGGNGQAEGVSGTGASAAINTGNGGNGGGAASSGGAGGSGIVIIRYAK